MTDIRFYHLTRKKLEEALPELLEKTLLRKWRAVVMTGSAERSEDITRLLWTYRGDSFLPHGSARDGNAETQPVWITEKDENPNGASVLFLTDGAETAHIDAFDLICEIFDGNDESATASARTRWSARKKAGHTISYWKQGESGWTREG